MKGAFSDVKISGEACQLLKSFAVALEQKHQMQ